MKGIKRILISSVLGAIFITSATLSFAQPTIERVPIPGPGGDIKEKMIEEKLKGIVNLPDLVAKDIKEAPTGTVTRPTQADLAIIGIYATNCKCDLPELDMFFMGEIAVEVSKKDISTPAAIMREPSAVVGTLVVTYYDPITRRDERQESMLQNSHFSAGTGTAYIKVISRPVLVKKSVGIRAEIRLNSPGYASTDPNAGNNVMTKKTCEVMLR